MPVKTEEVQEVARDEDGFSAHDYELMLDQFSDEFRMAVRDKVQGVVDTTLVLTGDPQGYKGNLSFGQMVIEAVVLWAVATKRLGLTKKSRVSYEDGVRRKAARLAAEQARNRQVVESLPSPAKNSDPRKSAGYL